MANSIIAAASGFLFWMIVARFYTPHDVGLSAAIISVISVIGFLSTLGFGPGLVRFLPTSGANSKAMMNTCFTIGGLAAILISLIFLLGLEVWSPTLLFLRENWLLFLSFVLFSIVYALYAMLGEVYVARRKAKFVLASTSLTSVKIVFPFVLAPIYGAFAIFASWSAALLLALVVGIFIFASAANPGYKPIPTLKRSVVKDMMHFSSVVYVGGIFGAISDAAVPLLIINVLGTYSVAYYYITYTIATLLFSITYAVSSSLFAEGSHFENHLHRDVKKALKLVFAILIPMVAVVFFLGANLLLLFGRTYSSEGVALLQVFVLSSPFVAVNNVFMTTQRVLKRLNVLVAVPIYLGISITTLGYLFMTEMGLVGIAIAWTLSHVALSTAIGISLLWKRRKRDSVDTSSH
jgi:O-antigen/teichoic acid export membrane protein